MGHPTVGVEASVTLDPQLVSRCAQDTMKYEAISPLKEDNVASTYCRTRARLDVHHRAVFNPWPHAEPKGLHVDGASAAQGLAKHIEAELHRIDDLSHYNAVALRSGHGMATNVSQAVSVDRVRPRRGPWPRP